MANNDPIITTATTIHGQFLEIAIALKKATDNLQEGVSRVEIDPDIVTGLIEIQATIPSEVNLAGEEIKFSASDQYPTIGGAGGGG